MSVKKVVFTFVVLWIAWIIFTGSLSYQELLVGGISAALISGVSAEIFTKNPSFSLNPRRWGYLIAYIPYYIWVEIKSHLNVAYRILHPSLPIKPAIVRLPTEFKNEHDVALTGLANSITMTPGTLTVDIDEDKAELYVHWITAGSLDTEKAEEEVGKPLERFLKGGLT